MGAAFIIMKFMNKSNLTDNCCVETAVFCNTSSICLAIPSSAILSPISMVNEVSGYLQHPIDT